MRLGCLPDRRHRPAEQLLVVSGQELAPEAEAGADGAVSAPPSVLGVLGVVKGTTRQQRLEDIDRCLEALASSALGVGSG